MRKFLMAAAVGMVCGLVFAEASAQFVPGSSSPIRLPGPYSAAGTPVPTCNSAAAGQTIYSTDITTLTFNATYASGGSAIGPLFCNGTNWTAH